MKIALLFPGYGDHYNCISKEIYDQSRLVQEYFEEATSCLNKDFTKLCFSSTQLDLSIAENAYPTIFLISACIWVLLKERKVEPCLLSGYNLGAYAALFAAGSISFPDSLYLLNKYAVLYQNALVMMPSVGVLSIKNMALSDIQKLCKQIKKEDERVDIALYNADNFVIVAGTSSSIDLCAEYAIQQQAEVQELPIEYGLHGPLLDAMAKHFALYLAKVDFKLLMIPLIDPVTGKIIQNVEQVKDMLIGLVNKPLHWSRSMQQLHDADLILQVGPGTTLAELVRKQMPDKKIMTINTWHDIEKITIMIQEQPSTTE